MTKVDASNTKMNRLAPALRTARLARRVSERLKSSAARLLALALIITVVHILGANLKAERATAVTSDPTLPVALATPTPTPTPTPVPDPPAYDIWPSRGLQGKDYEVLVTSNKCIAGGVAQNYVKDFELYARQGSGIRITESKATDCRITAKLSVAPDAPLSIVKLSLIDKDKIPRVDVDFTVTAVSQGPVPPGLGNGEVDVMWSVLPNSVTKDNFGGKVADQFYCIEAVIGNDSGYDLQLSSIGFTLPNLSSNRRIPTTGYRTVRGSLEHFGEVSPRKIIVNGLKTLGPILSGFLPFFHVEAHKANFSSIINLISNPIEKGIENTWPDNLPTYLDRLADQTFRDDISTKTIIPNNVQARIITFVPKRLVFPDKKPKDKVSNTHAIMNELGDMVLVGQHINYINRIRVVNTPFGTSITDHSVSGKITDGCNVGIEGVPVTLTGSGNFAPRGEKTSADGTYFFANVPDGRTYTVTPAHAKMKFTPTESTPFLLNDTRTNVNFSADHIVILGKISGENVGKIKVELSGAGLTTVPGETGNDGSFRFELPTPSNITTATLQVKPISTTRKFVPVTAAWSCQQRDANFKATPTPVPSPAP